MTREYRRCFEKLFYEVDSISELLLKFDIHHINYDASKKFSLAKYLFSLLRTFRHHKELDDSFEEWLEKSIDEIVDLEKVRCWSENAILNRQHFNSKLNSKILSIWVAKHGLNGITRFRKRGKKICQTRDCTTKR